MANGLILELDHVGLTGPSFSGDQGCEFLLAVAGNSRIADPPDAGPFSMRSAAAGYNLSLSTSALATDTCRLNKPDAMLPT